MGMKGKDDAQPIRLSGTLYNPAQQMLMPSVDAIKGTNGQNDIARGFVGIEAFDDFHDR
jgi:hypothetical protein